jgi:uroporphyrinogen decarboxylase
MNPERLAEATVALQRDFDLDLVKTSPNGMYAVEDFGVEIDFSQVSQGGVARIASTPFETVSDWAKLRDPDLTRGALARELHSLRLIRQALPATPIVFTLFSPMTIAAKLSRGRIHQQIADEANHAEIHALLGRLALTMREYAREAIEAGADGVFFAHQDTGRQFFDLDTFNEFVAPYDIETLTGAMRGSFNVLHIHGERIRFRELQDYPVHAVNWHSWETRPSVIAGALTSRKCVLGGIDRRSVTANDVPEIRRQIAASIAAMNGVGDLVLTPSCTIRAGFDPTTIHAIRDCVRSIMIPAARDLQLT